MVDSLFGVGYTDRFVWTVVQLYAYWSVQTGLESGGPGEVSVIQTGT